MTSARQDRFFGELLEAEGWGEPVDTEPYCSTTRDGVDAFRRGIAPGLRECTCAMEHGDATYYQADGVQVAKGFRRGTLVILDWGDYRSVFFDGQRSMV